MQRKVINPTTVFNSLQYGFSQAMEVPEGRRIMLSGQVGVDAQEHTVGPGIAEQTAAALDNIEKVLAEVGGSRKLAVERLGISVRKLRYKLQEYREAGFYRD